MSIGTKLEPRQEDASRGGVVEVVESVETRKLDVEIAARRKRVMSPVLDLVDDLGSC